MGRMKTTRRNFMISAGLAMAFPGLARAAVQATTRGAQESLSLV
jgi:alpha-L-fucosidase 2